MLDMATATLVFQGANRLRYLIAAAGTGAETVSIATIGGATPDTLTDSFGAGVIKALSKAVANGYGTFAAGAQTQAKARALWLSDLSGADPGAGSPNGSKLPTAKCTVTPNATGIGVMEVDANVSGGNPVINVSVTLGMGGYLDIIAPNTIGA